MVLVEKAQCVHSTITQSLTFITDTVPEKITMLKFLTRPDTLLSKNVLIISLKYSGQIFWACMGRNKMFPPSTSLPVMGVIAGVNTTSLDGCLQFLKTRARWVERFHDELNGHVFDLERDGLRQVVPCPWVTMKRQPKTRPHRIDRRPG